MSKIPESSAPVGSYEQARQIALEKMANSESPALQAQNLAKVLSRAETLIQALEYSAEAQLLQAGDQSLSAAKRAYTNGKAHGLQIAAENIKHLLAGKCPRLMTPEGARVAERIHEEYTGDL